MENVLVLCGGSGAHSGVAFLRFHILGYPLGFFGLKDGPVDFPTVFLIDQDAGDSTGQDPTAWQLARRLVHDHPGRFDWRRAIGRREPPALIQATPLPVGPNQSWSRRPCHQPRGRFEGSRLLDLIASRRQIDLDFSKGMMGSPAIGSLLFRLKDFDERGKGLNHDKTFAELLQTRGRVAVVGSGVGGTGASVAPTVSLRLAEEPGNHVMAIMLLRWFEFELGVEVETNEKAQARNRVMLENANSSFEFCGQTLATQVATVPVGMPEKILGKRLYTGDVGQPILESYIHAVTALCSYRHFLAGQPFGPGLYLMGAVEEGRLAGPTAIPGGTLQSLANQATTLCRTLETWHRVLLHPYRGRVRPAIHSTVGRHAEPRQVAECLGREIAFYREQIEWLESVVGIRGEVQDDLGLEARSREYLQKSPFEARSAKSPEEVASTLFHWTADWIRGAAAGDRILEVGRGAVTAAHWPNLKSTEGLGIAPRSNGDLDRIEDADRDAVLEAFVDPDHLSSNGWPHPLAPTEFFRHAIQNRDPRALRQLELLLVAMVSGRLRVRSLPLGSDPAGLSLERLFSEYRRAGYEALADWVLEDPQRDQVVAFTSPFTLLCPTSDLLSEEGAALWDELWRSLSGASDGADWSESEEPPTWGDQDLTVRQIRSWIEHQKRVLAGASPPWTMAFERFGGKTRSVPFGTGELVRIYWGSPSDPHLGMVDVNLPGSGRWIPAPETPLLDEEILLEEVPELRHLRDAEGSTLFQMVELEIPGSRSQVRGLWDEHLDKLRESEKIYNWSYDQHGGVVIASMTPQGLKVTLLANSQLLSRSRLVIQRCTPFLQERVTSTHGGEGEILYPDLPIRSDYLDLVETEDGERLLANLKQGVYPRQRWQPQEVADLSGRRRLRWTLRLRGRSQPLPVEIALEGQDAAPERAHWMVWPSFRGKNPGSWKAYYVYEKFPGNRQLALETLWLGGSDEPRLQRLVRDLKDPKGREIPAYPISYRHGANAGVHLGGPPVAFSVRHGKRDEEQGLYLIALDLLGSSPAKVQLAIDFGTSHSVAAARIGSETRHVNLRAELEEGTGNGMTLHLSEDRGHVEDSEEGGGILATGGWLPTYARRGNKGFLPSELLLYRRLTDIQGEEIEDWLPVSTYRIPPMDIGRQNLSEFLLADFKWDSGSKYFRGKEALLRENYLTHFLELVLAEVAVQHLKALPEQLVSCTFTYPLRSQENQVQVLRDILRRVLDRCQKSLGMTLELHENIGIYDESRAARQPTRKFGEVCVVADLGGGTLDLFVASEGSEFQQLPEIADSTRIGGNRLLQQIARAPAGILPANAGWEGDGLNDPEARERDIETKLRAWMRSLGSSRLFGQKVEGQTLEGHGAQGFSGPAQANRSRELVDLYFNLIIEYLARNLTAYLYKHWFPRIAETDHQELKISVQLRGNGWLLRYQDQSHTEATQAIQDGVREKVAELWKEIPDNPYPTPGVGHWLPASYYETYDPAQRFDPKIAPVMNAVGKAMPFEEVKKNWQSYTLARLDVRRGRGRERIEWFESVPFETGGSRDVQLDGISPPLVLNSSRVDKEHEVRGLPGVFEGSLNEDLKANEAVIEDGSYRAPVGPLIWEAIFDSKAFWPGE